MAPDSALPLWLEVVRAVGLGFGPFLTFGAAIIAAVIALRAYRQRKEADERAEWWRRAQWALDHASGQDLERGRVGLRTLDHLVDSELASAEDRALIAEVLAEVIEAVVERDVRNGDGSDLDNGLGGSKTGTRNQKRWFPWRR